MSEIYKNPVDIIFTTPFPDKKVLNSIPKSTIILDLGCGYGRVLKYFYENGYENLFGVDSSRKLINRANKFFPKAKYYNSNILTFKSRRKYGLIIICAVIEYLTNSRDRHRLITQLDLLLKEGGVIYLATFVRDKNYSKEYTKVKKNTKWGTLVTADGIKLYHASPEEIDNLFQKKFKKISSVEKLFNTWSEKTTNGYICLFKKT